MNMEAADSAALTANALPSTSWPISRVSAETADTAATWVSRLTVPPVMAGLGVGLVAAQDGSPGAWTWAVSCIAIGVGLPLAYVLWLLRRGEVGDFHIPVRKERLRPMRVAVAAALVTTVLLVSGGAPRLFVALAAASTLQNLLMLLVTLRWKISAHTAATASVGVLIVGLLGMASLPVLATIPLVAWSRVRLGRHSVGQTIAGALVGAILMALGLAWAL